MQHIECQRLNFGKAHRLCVCFLDSIVVTQDVALAFIDDVLDFFIVRHSVRIGDGFQNRNAQSVHSAYIHWRRNDDSECNSPINVI